MSYRLAWSENGREQEKTVDTATIADNWIGELRGRGIAAVTLFRDGEEVPASELPALATKEASSGRDAAES
ncbi:hypothetical protein [Rhizosaccharibacter radicis]|uniref:DUF2188 domain-containing protein n=1 Tax=Rhizosaccharibacter radicis TaxID=2782605 RepID=A0ABT1VY74_9PROT|nr:hypothetical protein [Acetobacteraceae bacterium KSS12]